MSWPRNWPRRFCEGSLLSLVLGACISREPAVRGPSASVSPPSQATYEGLWETVLQQKEAWYQEQVRRMGGRVYRVEVTGRYRYTTERYKGTAWLWAGRVVVTCRHLFPSAPQLEVELWDSQGGCHTAYLLWRDTVADVAFLRSADLIGEGLVRAAGVPLPSVGTVIWTLGAPWGLAGTLQEGFISGEERYLAGETGEKLPFLQLSLPAQPGSSGSPVFDRRGQVIGMVSEIASASGLYEGITFAIPVHVLEQVWARYCSFAAKYDTTGACTSRQ